MTGVELIAAAKNASALAEFISGGGLQAAVASVVGDVHTDAAKLALSMSTSSNSPRDRLKSAVTHLEAAQAAYLKILVHTDSLVACAWHAGQIMETEKKSRYVCSLMAVCYAHLGDVSAARQALEMARQAFKYVENMQRDGVAYTLLVRAPLAMTVGALNPDFWMSGFKDTFHTIRHSFAVPPESEKPGMSREEIDTLAERLEEIAQVAVQL